MAMTFTQDQQKVITTRNRNILVSAAAGSGKTAVLVERIIQKICDEAHPVDIDRLLIVTFTSAAAAQMRERISRAITAKLEENPQNEHLQRQAALIHNAQIATIHSFCLFVIRNNFNEIGLDPGFRIADEGEIKLLETDVMEKLLEQEHANAQESFLTFVESYSTGNSEKRIEEAIARLYHFAMSYPFPEDWLYERSEDYRLPQMENLLQRPWYQAAMKYFEAVLEECLNRLDRAIALANSVQGPIQYLSTLEEDKEQLSRLYMDRDCQYSTLYDRIGALTFGRLSSKKNPEGDPLLKDMVKAIRDEVKKNVTDLKKQLFSFSAEDMAADMAQCGQQVEELVRLTLSYKALFDAAKRDKNIIDFSDMEHFTLQILLKKDEDGQLVPRETALAFQDYFEEIMIDEYQDSNEVQELLLKSISGESKGHFNRFMVGDVKQSIYKFRLARPEIFMEKYRIYQLDEEAQQVRIDLSKNFRSRGEVTQAANFLCGQLMKPAVGNVDYDEHAALYVGAAYPEPKGTSAADCYQTELLIALEESEEDEVYKEEQDREKDSEPGSHHRYSDREKEASLTAARIEELVGQFPVTDAETGELRPARYSDIVILMRSTAGWDEEFRRVLSQRGIPVHVTSRTGYFRTLEIQGIVNFLQVLDNPLQDIPFYGVLRLPFLDFSEEEITQIVCFADAQKEEGEILFLYEKLLRYEASQEHTELWQKAVRALELIREYRRKIAYTPIKELIQDMILHTGYGAYVGAMPGGEQRKANLELLLERAGDFEKTSYYGLFHFIRYLETMQEQEVDFGEANTLDENADVVRIMTIHKSKGLEFPICFVCGLAKNFNQMDTNQAILMDVELGIGVDCIDPVMRTKRRTLRKNVVAQRMKEDSRGEDLRVLYVALTRAKEKLILTGYLPGGMEKLLGKYQYLTLEEEQKLPYSVLMSANSYLELLIAALMRHTGIRELLEQAGLSEMHADRQLPYAETPFLVKTVSTQQLDMPNLFRIGKAAMLEEVLEQPAGHAEEELLTQLKEKLDYRYPYQYLEGLTVKTTVSELKRAAYAEEQEEAGELLPPPREAYVPRFVSEDEQVQGTQYGTAVHKAMELLAFDASYRLSGELAAMSAGKRKALLTERIRAQMKQWIEQGRVRAEEISCVRAERLAAFLETELAQRMIQAACAGQLYREQPFVLGIAAKELKEQYPEDELVLIQGVMDAFFEEEGELVLVDYKTDKVQSGQELVERYHAQLEYYQMALERITGKRVKERLLYAFSLESEIAV